MKIRLLRYYFIIGFLLFAAITTAQNNNTKDYASHPYWIGMMADTNANYFETVKAFNGYWKDRVKPQPENEKFERADNGAHTNEGKNIPYSFEYKKFQHWQMQVKPYVQNDGFILFPYQRRLLRLNARSANLSTIAK